MAEGSRQTSGDWVEIFMVSKLKMRFLPTAAVSAIVMGGRCRCRRYDGGRYVLTICWRASVGRSVDHASSLVSQPIFSQPWRLPMASISVLFCQTLLTRGFLRHIDPTCRLLILYISNATFLFIPV